MAWFTILILVLGGLVGYGVRRPRPLLVALVVDLIVLALAHDQGVHWLIVVLSPLLPLLAAALVGAILRTWYMRSKTGWGRRASRPNDQGA